MSAQSELAGYPSRARLLRAGLEIGEGVTIGKHTYIDRAFAWAITIGPNVTISWNVTIIAHDAALCERSGYTRVLPVKVGADAYIGAGALVLPGTTIGDGAIVGAGCVARGVIPAGAVVAGNPLRVVGSAEESVERLLGGGLPRMDVARKDMARAEMDECRRLLGMHNGVLIR